jgi:hypothetical protein
MIPAGQPTYWVSFLDNSFPTTDLHRAVFLQVPVHIERLEQQMRLVSHPLSQALKLGLVEVILEDRSVIWVCALVDDHARSFSWRQTSHIGQTLVFWGHGQSRLGLVWSGLAKGRLKTITV